MRRIAIPGLLPGDHQSPSVHRAVAARIRAPIAGRIGTSWRQSSWVGWPCWATLDAWSDIFLIARKNEEYSHIFLVPFVAAAMIFVRRARFRYCKPTGTAIGFLIAALGWAVHVFGFYHNFESLWHVGAVLVVVGCVLSVFGKHALFRFFPADCGARVPGPGTGDGPAEDRRAAGELDGPDFRTAAERQRRRRSSAPATC